MFPNPVRSGESISLQMTSEKMRAEDVVQLSIYNVRGQLVSRSGDISFKDGNGSFVWDKRDMHGTEVASGVYFYRVSGGDSSVTGRFLVIK